MRDCKIYTSVSLASYSFIVGTALMFGTFISNLYGNHIEGERQSKSRIKQLEKNQRISILQSENMNLHDESLSLIASDCE